MKTKILILLITINTIACFGQEPVFFEHSIYLNNSIFPSAILQIDLIPGELEITRPFIIAEGFDPGSITNPEEEYGSEDIFEFRDRLFQDAGDNLRELIDPTNEDQEYDIIYVNWTNGTDAIQENALVLEEVINWVNAQKVISGSLVPNVLLGQSMGGLVGRYTLASMEDAGDNHDVRLFIAHDSPMQGANTPISIQYFSRHAYDQYTSAPLLYANHEVLVPTILNFVELMSLGGIDIAFPSISDILTIQDTPAAMQMNYHYVDYDSNPTTALHDAWQLDFENVGYPMQSRNIAISNGNECAVDHGFDTGAKFLNLHDTDNPDFWGDLVHLIATPFIGSHIGDPALEILGTLPGSSKYFYDIDIHANPDAYASNRQVYWGKIRYEKKLLWVVPISHTMTERTKDAPSGYLPFDTYSGGFYDINNVIGDYTGYLPSGTVVNPRYGFIPVVSALDIKRNNSNVNPADYVKSYAGGNTPEPALTSGFNNFIVDFMPNSPINNRHISFQQRNGDWLATELGGTNAIADDCSISCSTNAISGPDNFCTGTRTYSAPVGADSYQWFVLPDNLVATDPLADKIEITSPSNNNSILLEHSGDLSGWVNLSVVINSSGCDVQNLQLTKRVYVGAPLAESVNIAIGSPVTHISTASDPNGCEIPLKLEFDPNSSEVTDIEWEKITTDIAWSRDGWDYDDSYVFLYPTCNKVFEFKVRAKNNCGFWSPWQELQYNITECATDCQTSGGNIESDNFRLFPVPANTVLNIQIIDNHTWLFPTPTVIPGGNGNYTHPSLNLNIIFYNNVGTVVYSTTTTGIPAQVDVSGLPAGTYVMTIGYLGQLETHNISIN